MSLASAARTARNLGYISWAFEKAVKLVRTIGKKGYDIITANDGQAALNAYKAAKHQNFTANLLPSSLGALGVHNNFLRLRSLQSISQNAKLRLNWHVTRIKKGGGYGHYLQ